MSHLIDHAHDDGSIVVFDGLLHPVESQGGQNGLLVPAGADAAFDLPDSYSCHLLLTFKDFLKGYATLLGNHVGIPEFLKCCHGCFYQVVRV